MKDLQKFLEDFPVSTAIAVIVAIAGAVDLCIGGLSDGFATYSAIVMGGNAGLAVGRGLIARKR